jgi:hypothetical protein
MSRASSRVISILLGRGDGTFETSRDFALDEFLPDSPAVTSTVTALPDIAATNEFPDAVSILINNTTTPAR